MNKLSDFVERWRGRGNERSDTQKFWLSFLQNVLGIENPYDVIEFEKRVELSRVSFIDGYIPSTCTIIEQKSCYVNLDNYQEQSDGSYLTPFEQAKRYYDWLPKSEKGNYIVVCNFQEFRIHDMEHPKAAPKVIFLENLEEKAEKFSFLIEPEEELKKLEEAKRNEEENRKQEETRRQAEEAKQQLEEAQRKVAEAQEQAEEALKQLKFEEKLRQILLKNHEEGPTDAQSQFDLGKKYTEGKKYEKAFYWYFQSAEQGHAEAQCEVASRMSGQNAVKWYCKAAEQGCVRAQRMLGYMYRCGYKVEKNISEACYWYWLASGQGDVDSLCDFGLLCMHDLKDYNEAIDYFLRAALRGSIFAQYEIGEIYNLYYKDWPKAVNWYRKAAQQGFWLAKEKLGDIYYYGVNDMRVKKDILEAVYWWSSAALNENSHAEAMLKILYRIEKKNDDEEEEEEEEDERSQAEIKRRKDEIKKIEEIRRKIGRAKTQQNSEEIPKQFFKLGEYYYSSYPHDSILTTVEKLQK